MHGDCLDLCSGLTFTVISDDFQREHFPQFVFPDIRRVTTDFEIPIPDDDTMSSVVRLELDRSVPVKGKSSFEVAKERLELSHHHMLEACQRARGIAEKRRVRSDWQTQALVPFKSIFNTSSAISPSMRSVIEDWELLDEKFHGIPIPLVTVEHHQNIDRQCAYVAAFYAFAECAGFFCHHSMFIQVMINSRWACRKGRGRGPHTILFGSPGSVKSHIILMCMLCMFSGFCAGMSSMSRLAWAVKDALNPDNPDTCQAQIAILVDEVPASYLGAADNGAKKGEGDDNVATFKEMLSAAYLTWRRNIEAKTNDGVKVRALESGLITNEPVFIGGMNRSPRDINPAFRRRLSFLTCVQFKRGDGKTFEDSKVQGKRVEDDYNSEMNKWVRALKMNSQLHALVAFAEYYKIIEPPSTDVWEAIIPDFQIRVEYVTSVPNLDDRIDDAKNRLILLCRMIAIFEVYQTTPAPRPQTFDEIVSKLPEVEKYTVPGEKLCLAVMSSLEDVCFPLMHKIVLRAIMKKWPDLEEYEGAVFTNKGVTIGRYTKINLRSVAALARGEDARACGRRVLFQELRAIISSESSHYQIEGGEQLAEAAIEELMGINAPDHPVIVAREDPADGRVEVLISLVRLENIDQSIAGIISDMAKKGTQLMMTPYTEGEDYVLPQFPMFVEGQRDEELLDRASVKRRKNVIFNEDTEDLFRLGTAPAQYPQAHVQALRP